MNLVLWILQFVLGAMFIMAGATKAFAYDKALASLPWVKDVSHSLVSFIGISEFLGGIGLILPAATKILPVLTPVAAMGLALVMLLATAFHLSRGEYAAVGFTLALGLAAAFVAYGRIKLRKI